MSASSEKGVSLEKFIAKTLQKKLRARVQRDSRSGAGSHQKMDINDFYQDTPFDIEAKNHKTVAIKEWMRQAKAGASLNRIPTVVFQADDDVLACVPFDALVDLAVQVKDLTAEIADLRAPVSIDFLEVGAFPNMNLEEAIKRAKTIKKADGISTCRAGHIVSPGSNKCLDKHCKYSSTYKPKKEKK